MAQILVPSRRVLSRQPPRPLDLDLSSRFGGAIGRTGFVFSPFGVINKGVKRQPAYTAGVVPGAGAGGVAMDIATTSSQNGLTVSDGLDLSLQTGGCTVLVVCDGVTPGAGSAQGFISAPASSGNFFGYTAAGLPVIVAGGSAQVTASDAIPTSGVHVLAYSYLRGSLAKIYIDGRLIASATPAAVGVDYAPTLFGHSSVTSTHGRHRIYGGALFARRVLSDNDVAEVSRNFWQLLRPERRIAYFDLGAGSAVNLTIADATHDHAADSLGLSSDTALGIAEASHAHLADSVTLTTQWLLTVADALHGHAADNVTLSATGEANLLIADAVHSHSAENLALSTQAFLGIVDAVHAHQADNLTLGTGATTPLTVQDASHGHAAESLALTLDSWLAIVDAWHAHVADSIDLSSQQSLAIAWALHAHFADSPHLVLPSDVVFVRAPSGSGPSIILPAGHRPGQGNSSRPSMQAAGRPGNTGGRRL